MWLYVRLYHRLQKIFEYFVWLSVTLYHCYTRFWKVEKTFFKICCSLCETVSQVSQDFWIFCVAFCDTVSLLHQILENLCLLCWDCNTVTPDFGNFVSLFVLLYHMLHQISKQENFFFKICIPLCETVSHVTPDFAKFLCFSVWLYHLLHQIWKQEKHFYQNLSATLWDCITCNTSFENRKNLGLCGIKSHECVRMADFEYLDSPNLIWLKDFSWRIIC